MNAAQRSQIKESKKSRIIGFLIGWILRFYCRFFVRFKISAHCFTEEHRPRIFCLWHGCIFVSPAGWNRSTRGRRPLTILTSASRDGAMLAQAMRVFGNEAVRGSSSRRGAEALVALRNALKGKKDVAITPDGPRGPRCIVQPGAIKLAQLSSVPIVPVRIHMESAWNLNTWDRFQIPKPFSRVHFIYDEPIMVPRKLDENEFESLRLQLQGVLRQDVDDLVPEKNNTEKL